MGIDIQTFSRELPKRFLGRSSGRDALEKIAATASDWANTRALGPFYWQRIVGDRQLLIRIYPLADAIDFELSERGVAVNARTSNGGPGYHAALIDLIDHIAQAGNMKFHWGTASNSTDETGYALSRDFEALQSYHSGFMRSLAELAIEPGRDAPALCLPLGLGAISGRISAPPGILPPSWPEQVMDATDEDLMKLASEFFSWWPKEMNVQFWRSTLRGLLWQSVVWREPRQSSEEFAHQQADYCVRQLAALNTALPPDLEQAVRELNACVEEGAEATENGIGYLRRPVTHTPFAGWSITLPGEMSENLDDPDPEGEAVQLIGRHCALRISCMRVGKKSNETFSWPASFRDLEEFGSVNVRYRMEPFNDGDGCFHQFAMAVRDGPQQTDILMLTLTTEAVEQLSVLKQWLCSITFSDQPHNFSRRDETLPN